jgi:AbrB family looped-hinge helix DNA binding protein
MTKDSKKEILGMTSMSHKFQITIPKRVREKYHLEEGQTIMFVEENDRVYLAKSTDV